MEDETFRILLIDDRRSDLKMTKRAVGRNLAGVKHEIAEANDLAPGLQAYENALNSGKPFDLVVTDYQLMRGNGVEILEVIRTDFNDSVPVVIVSASPDPRMVRLSEELGGQGFFSKGDSSWLEKGPEEFQKIVEKAVKAKQNTSRASSGGSGPREDEKKHHREFQTWRSAFGERMQIKEHSRQPKQILL